MIRTLLLRARIALRDRIDYRRRAIAAELAVLDLTAEIAILRGTLARLEAAARRRAQS